MSLPKDRQEDLARKIDRIHHELVHEFPSRYPESTYKETLVGYVLELDRKVEDMHANMLPKIFKSVSESVSKITDLLKRKGN